MKYFKRTFIALAAVLISLSTFTACNSNSNVNEPSTTEITTEVVTTVTATTVASTTVEPTTVEPTTVEPTTVEPTTVEPTTVKTTQPITEAIRAEVVENEMDEIDEEAEDGRQDYISSNADNADVDADNDYNDSEVNYNAHYSPNEFQNSGVINWGSYDWTYYSELILPGDGLDIPGRYTTEDGYVCDSDGYVVLAADLSMLPRYSVVDTPFGREGKVYDTGCAYGVLDVYVGW